MLFERRVVLFTSSYSIKKCRLGVLMQSPVLYVKDTLGPATERLSRFKNVVLWEIVIVLFSEGPLSEVPLLIP